MNKIFRAGPGFPVPDGTIVQSVLDPRLASEQRASWVDDVSLAVGTIPANTTSQIHLHPVVTQVTWVLSGKLTVKMKDPDSKIPYTLNLSPEESVLTQPGTFFQLINVNAQECRVLYMVTPAFIFEATAEGVRYNDAIVLEEGWEDLTAKKWILPQLQELERVRQKRRESIERLKKN